VVSRREIGSVVNEENALPKLAEWRVSILLDSRDSMICASEVALEQVTASGIEGADRLGIRKISSGKKWGNFGSQPGQIVNENILTAIAKRPCSSFKGGCGGR